jgi:hypothetical protein
MPKKLGHRMKRVICFYFKGGSGMDARAVCIIEKCLN